jgi:cellulose synthase (UDP-forming)
MNKLPTGRCLGDDRRGLLKPGAPQKVRREIFYTRVSIALTVAVATVIGVVLSRILVWRFQSSHDWFLLQDAFFVLVVYAFIYGSLLHQFSRLGYFKRLRSHRPAERCEVEAFFDMDRAPSLAVLVPSYREELRVVRQTLISSALLEYPNRRVVLLIDDPPHPDEPEAAAELEAMRRLPLEVQAMLTPLHARYLGELRGFERRRAKGGVNVGNEIARLARLYIDASIWLEDRARRCDVNDHTDALFVERILREPADEHRARASELIGWEKVSDPVVAEQRLLHEYRRLAALFAVRLSVFERKRFTNLSHAPNKAMNLNSYISLLGKSFRALIRPDGLHIEECERRLGRLHFPQADYLITLDADSLLMNSYAARLIQIMEQPGNERIAVAQTPYSAVPGKRSLIERTAGAFTDIQYIVHQGYCHHGAAFWVGANALLRRTALEDICVEAEERGFAVRKYIQDRTVIEDTESSLDLVSRGWRIFNYLERLAYSATPPDFGSLIV